MYTLLLWPLHIMTVTRKVGMPKICTPQSQRQLSNIHLATVTQIQSNHHWAYLTKLICLIISCYQASLRLLPQYSLLRHPYLAATYLQIYQ